MNRLLLISALVLAAQAQPATAQNESRELVSTVAKRAINLARGIGAAANGGLRLYHPARCMYMAPTNNPCLTKSDANGFEFRFLGVLIAPDGRSVIAESHKDIGEVTFPPSPSD